MRRRVAVVYFLGGLAVLVWLVLTQSFPPLGIFLAFLIANVYFEWRSVEVNDRLQISGGAMVVLTAGVAFGSEAAPLGMALIAAAGAVQRQDLTERRWFQPTVNFGLLVLSATAAGFVLRWFLPTTISADVADLAQTTATAVAAAAVLAGLSFIQLSWVVRLVYGRRDVRPWSGMPQILGAALLMGTLGGLLGATFTLIGQETFPLLLALFLIAHMGLAAYADLREAHEATIRGFIKALEAKDMFTHGHTERVAKFTSMIGEELGWSADRLELMRWSALLHDVGTLAVPRDLLRNRDQLSDAEERQLIENTETVEKVLAQSDFLAPMMERAARVRMLYSEAPKDQITQDAQVLAVAKWFDYVTSGKSHSEALSQDRALSALRAESPYRYDPVVVAALASALDKVGLRYGAVEGKQQLTREDISKQAMYDR